MQILPKIFMSLGVILGISVAALMVYRYVIYRRNNPVLIPKQMDARVSHRFPSTKFRLSDVNGGLEYSFNYWMYISNMDYRYGQEKILFFWKGKGGAGRAICKHEQEPDTSTNTEHSKRSIEIKENCPFCENVRPLGPEPFIGTYQNTPAQSDNWEHFTSESPKVYSGIIISIAPKSNDLMIRQSLLDGTTETLVVPKVPIQKWLHVVVILKQRYLDVFINGKLITSRHLRSIPIYHPSRLAVNPNGGFSGYISRVQYHNRSLTIQDVRHHFSRGPPTELETHVASSPTSRMIEDLGYSQ